MREYEATGRTVEDAISAALAQSGLSIGEVTVEILEEGSKGLFGFFGSREARVRVTPNKAEETMSAAHEVFKDALADKNAPRREERAAAKAEKAAEPAPEKPARQRKTRKRAGEAAVPAAEVQEKQPRAKRQPKPKETKPVEPVAPAEQAELGTPQGIAQQFLRDVTRLMGLEVSVAVARDEEGNVQVTMAGDPQGILIGRRGETLDALQYLTSLKVNHRREEYIRVSLDSEGYRKRREDALIRLANRMANRAKRTGRRVRMEPMNPYERRILHSALQDVPGIGTHSEGEDPNRRVIITPLEGRGGEEEA
ncbi:MAG: RNA-binding cell elongation regulator Jag/EloR [Christensenellales bacterium]|jgi:spoIIIJ-associated protein